MKKEQPALRPDKKGSVWWGQVWQDALDGDANCGVSIPLIYHSVVWSVSARGDSGPQGVTS